jgi:non-specific serine/threonine protein kinase
MIGKTISHYKVLEKLGGGAMGVVYRAEDLKLKRSVAIKFLPPELTRDPKAKERLIQEAQAASALDHTNICNIHEIDETEDGQIFMILAYYEGETLKKKIQRGPLKLEDTIDIAVQVAQGLAKAHERGIIHRDIKPANLMIKKDRVVKVVDFGLAILAEQTELARDDAVSGTLAYMSPEQVSGEVVDHRTDIWSLGVVLYEMLTGKLPFEGEYEQALVYSILNEEPEPISNLRLGVPRELEQIVDKAMAKRPEQRYQHISDVLVDLETLKKSVDSGTTISTAGGDAYSIPNNLPLQLTSFIGRDQQMTDVRQLLRKNRLLTLTGAGGCGKTRLALEVARNLLGDFSDGVWLSEFATLVDSSLVPHTVAATLGLKEESNRPLTKTLVNYLKGKKMLLVLDNCEHLIAACRSLVDTLLRGCPELRVLATSRERLTITGEVMYQIPPLSIPEAKKVQVPLSQLHQIEAVRLFLERANAVRAGFNLSQENAPAIVKICRRLDGIPLALELAAARLGVMAVEDIARRLDDRFGLLAAGTKNSLPQHQTLSALIDWSYDHLSEVERELFCRLSVFAGGWTLDSAEAVCAGNGIQRSKVLDLHSRLVNRSLVEMDAERGRRTGVTRYRMLGIMQEYARNHLKEQERVEVWLKHQDYFLALAEESARHLTGPEQTTWAMRLEAENDNLRAALDRYTRKGSNALLALQMAGALGRFWYMRGRWSEGRNLLSEILARPDTQQRTEFRARALDWTGWLAYFQGEFKQALTVLEESLNIWRELGNSLGIAQTLNNLGAVANGQGNYEQSRIYHAESLAIRRKHGDRRSIAVSLHNLGEVYLSQEDYDQARKSFEESLPIFKEVGYLMGVADSLNSLGIAAEGQGDYDYARACYEESLSNRLDRQEPNGVSESLHNLGQLAVRQGQLNQARVYYMQSLMIRQKLGNRLHIADSLEGLGTLAAVCENPQRTARLLAAARSLREGVDALTSSTKQDRLNTIISKMCSALGEVAFIKEWDLGRAMPLDQAIDYALKDEETRSGQEPDVIRWDPRLKALIDKMILKK